MDASAESLTLSARPSPSLLDPHPYAATLSHPCSTPTLATAPCAGEIIPQAVCSKHGLMIGSLMAGPVRFLMILTAPISWPVSKLLDTVLGGDHASLFRRKQLKVRAGREEAVYG